MEVKSDSIGYDYENIKKERFEPKSKLCYLASIASIQSNNSYTNIIIGGCQVK